MKLIDRPEYLEQLKKWQASDDLVKIVTGVRRCGKSKLFELFQEYLQTTGVTEEQLVKVNLEDGVQQKKIGLTLDKKTQLLQEYGALLDFVMAKIAKVKPGLKVYVFLDEIQMLENWFMVANTLRLQKNVDVYLTGSNAYMFSSDLHNVFGGRFIEIKMQPLSFKEYASAYKDANGVINTEWEKNNYVAGLIYGDYINESGFPQTAAFHPNKEMIKTYLMDSVYNNTIHKDIVLRFGITDEVRLQEVVRFMFDNISNPTSLRGIHNSLKSNKIELAPTTLNNYVKGLLDSYLMYKCKPYDIKGKRLLESDAKYYACDMGLRAAVLGKDSYDVGRALENVIYLELLRRGYAVKTGKIPARAGTNALEVDFVAEKPGGILEYYQVAWTAFSDDGETMRRELTPLEEIKDNYPKYLMTMDIGSNVNDGIKRLNVLDWLLGNTD